MKTKEVLSIVSYLKNSKYDEVSSTFEDAYAEYIQKSNSVISKDEFHALLWSLIEDDYLINCSTLSNNEFLVKDRIVIYEAQLKEVMKETSKPKKLLKNVIIIIPILVAIATLIIQLANFIE